MAKKDSDLRPCIDYRALNKITVKFRYPLPLVPSALEHLRGATVFTKLDLRSAYNLIRIREGDEWKTAFVTPTGHYEYLVMLYGLVNAPSVFQYFMHEVLREFLHKSVLVYIDDILIYSRSMANHRRHVAEVLQRLRDYRLFLKAKKCVFHQSTVQFLGYIINRSGVRMDERKAFEKLKTVFTTAPLLVHPDPELPFIVEVDTSTTGVGAVLSQQQGNPRKLHPCAFFSRKLSPAEVNYDISNWELLAIKLALEEWRHWLEGAKHPFVVLTDHKNLEYLRAAKRLNPHQFRETCRMISTPPCCSAFNNIIPYTLTTKLQHLGLSPSLCQWISNLLTGRPQAVRIGRHVSVSLILSTGAPQGCVRSPLLYSLYTYDFVATNNSITIKFADDTVVVGLISDNNETAYLEEIRNLENWCQRISLLFNVSKTKEPIVNFSTKQERNYQTPLINESPVERVDSFRYLGLHITQDLSWSCHINIMVKKVRQCLYHLRRLRDFRLPSKVLRNFYSYTIESILMGNIMTWFGNSTMQELFRGWCDQLNASFIPSSLTCTQFTASGAGPRPGRS
ncbi:hypothetical protein QTP86_001847 [Hemibagrus guttatus]|nr:hypothetical protein QTP86_001847 [Hemibagrus guttatus]